jgi:hypothetical protein
MNYDCEAGGAQPEEFDDEIRDSEDDSNEDDDITDNELNIQEDGESDAYGEEDSPETVKRYSVSNKLGGKRKKKKNYKRTKLESLPEDEDYEDEEEICGGSADNGRPVSTSPEKTSGQIIA